MNAGFYALPRPSARLNQGCRREVPPKGIRSIHSGPLPPQSWRERGRSPPAMITRSTCQRRCKDDTASGFHQDRVMPARVFVPATRAAARGDDHAHPHAGLMGLYILSGPPIAIPADPTAALLAQSDAVARAADESGRVTTIAIHLQQFPGGAILALTVDRSLPDCPPTPRCGPLWSLSRDNAEQPDRSRYGLHRSEFWVGLAERNCPRRRLPDGGQRGGADRCAMDGDRSGHPAPSGHGLGGGAPCALHRPGLQPRARRRAVPGRGGCYTRPPSPRLISPTASTPRATGARGARRSPGERGMISALAQDLGFGFFALSRNRSIIRRRAAALRYG